MSEELELRRMLNATARIATLEAALAERGRRIAELEEELTVWRDVGGEDRANAVAVVVRGARLKRAMGQHPPGPAKPGAPAPACACGTVEAWHNPGCTLYPQGGYPADQPWRGPPSLPQRPQDGDGDWSHGCPRCGSIDVLSLDSYPPVYTCHACSATGPRDDDKP